MKNHMKVGYYLKFISLCLILSSCKKDILEIEPNYEGEWHTASVILDSGREIESYFIIDGDNAVFAERCDVEPLGTNCSVYKTGKVLTTKNQKKIFIGDPNKDFQMVIEIDEAPHLNSDGKWECTLMGAVFIKN